MLPVNFFGIVFGHEQFWYLALDFSVSMVCPSIILILNLSSIREHRGLVYRLAFLFSLPLTEPRARQNPALLPSRRDLKGWRLQGSGQGVNPFFASSVIWPPTLQRPYLRLDKSSAIRAMP
jgi:hypothetical protein